MSIFGEDFPKATAGKSGKLTIDDHLCAAIEALNLDLEKIRAADRCLTHLSQCQSVCGSDWLRVWNRSATTDIFQTEEEAASAQEEWQSIIRGYDDRAATGLERMNEILALGADPDADEGRPLYLASSHGNLALIKALHEAGASLERRTSGPYSAYSSDPLKATWQCGADHVDAAKLLIALGCKACDEDVYWARQHRSHGVEQCLKDRGFTERLPEASAHCAFESGMI